MTVFKISALVFAAVVSIVGGIATTRFVHRDHSNAILLRERLAIDGLDGRFRQLEDAVAPVVTDAQTRRALVRFLVAHGAELHEAELDLQEAVRSRLGGGSNIVYVSSGSVEWVPTRVK